MLHFGLARSLAVGTALYTGNVSNMTLKSDIHQLHRDTAFIRETRLEIEAMSEKEEAHENDEDFPKEPDRYEREYGEYGTEKMLDDRERYRGLK